MIWIDYIILVLAVLLIIFVLFQESKDDIKDAFSGERSELFKNDKARGPEVVINRITVVMVLVLITLVLVSLGIDRF